MTANELRLSLTDEQIIKALKLLGVENYREEEKAIVFPTICHNANIDQASMKLYYYRDTKLFHCYTDCGDSFDIFRLFARYYETRGIEYNYYRDIYDVITSNFETIVNGFESFVYEKQANPLKRKRTSIELTEYDNSVLDVFTNYRPAEWLEEGISANTMDKFNIKYSISQNKIIIPHYDINNRLVGIRGRALDPEDIAKGKYRPIWVEEKLYNHPLSLNLYGLEKTIEQVKRKKEIVLFESEKSVLLMDSYFSDNNSAAVCGSNLNKNQINLLLKNCPGVNIVIAFDKEYQRIDSLEATQYLDKIRSIGKKYNKYFNFYYIADRQNLLSYKDSPIDKGPEIFEHLLKNKILIGA